MSRSTCAKKMVNAKIELYGVVLLTFLVFLQSCTNQKAENPIPMRPPMPLPTLSCGPSLLYGYTDKTSYLPGEKVNAFLQSKETISLCRLDVYALDGKVAFSVSSPLTMQTITPDNPSVNGYGFAATSQIELPTNLKSGLYLIENRIPFIVKTNSKVDFIIIYPSNTTNAYSRSGGRSLYEGANRPFQVSFLRPVSIQSNAEYGLKWFASLSKYKIGYIADSDMDDFGSIQNSSMLVIVGHSEYWTRQARKNFDRYVAEGNDALVLSGNTMWWQVRYTDNKAMVCYKSQTLDPIADPLLKTIEWNNVALQYSILSSIGADFPRGGYGLQRDNGWDGYKIVTPTSPLLSGLNLRKGEIISLPSGEYDGAPISNFTPDGYPIIDKAKLNFEKVELIGFDLGSRGGKETVGTFIVFKKTTSSGVVINAASYDWCSARGMGGRDGNALKQITLNAIDHLLTKTSVFAN